MIALLFLLFAFFGFGSGSSSVSSAPVAPARAPLAQTALAPTPSCVTLRFSQGRPHMPCNARSRLKP